MRFYFILFLSSLFSYVHAQNVIIDVDGNEYRTIQMGKQIWMAENLKVIHSPDGNQIESYCIYNDSSYCRRYGRLYNWEVLMNGSEEEGSRGICPEGWHIPSDTEWDKLVESAGGHKSAGQLLKMEKGFNVIMAGNYHHEIKVFNYVDRQAYFWSSSTYSKTAAWMRQIGVANKNINRSTVKKEFCFSVRCVKD